MFTDFSRLESDQTCLHIFSDSERTLPYALRAISGNKFLIKVTVFAEQAASKELG